MTNSPFLVDYFSLTFLASVFAFELSQTFSVKSHQPVKSMSHRGEGRGERGEGRGERGEGRGERGEGRGERGEGMERGEGERDEG